jgi:hypothetical protein
MPPAICPKCYSHVATLREYAATEIQNIVEFAERMQSATAAAPDDLKPFGEALTKHLLERLTELYAASLERFSELAMQEITRAAATSAVAPLAPNTRRYQTY